MLHADRTNQTVQLLPVGSLEIQIRPVGLEDHASYDLAGVVALGGTQQEGVQVSGALGAVESRSDASGKIVIAQIAVGKLRLELYPPPTATFDVVMASTAAVMIRTGETTRVEFTTEPLRKVTGRVVASRDGAPISGTIIYSPYPSFGFRKATSNQGGEFEISIPRKLNFLQVQPPPGFISPPGAVQSVSPDRISRDSSVEFVLDRARTLTGTVVDQENRPVKHAQLRVFWRQEWLTEGHLRMFSLGRRAGTCGKDGRFTITGVSAEAPLFVEAYSDTASIDESLVVKPEETGELSLVLAEEATFRLSGRVLDPRGAAVPGAHVALKARSLRSDFPLPEQLRVEFPRCEHLTTGADGRFSTPIGLPRHQEYYLQVTATNYPALSLGPIRGVKNQPETLLGDLALRPFVEVSGRVVDRGGSAIEGAEVFAESEQDPESRLPAARTASAKTDADGRFRLTGLRKALPLIFVRHPDFRLTGTAVPEDPSTEVTLTMSRPGEPSMRALGCKTVRLPKPEQAALILQLIEAGKDDWSSDDWASLLIVLAKLDPATTLKWIDRVSETRQRYAVYNAMEKYDEAIADTLATEDAYDRYYMFSRIADYTRDERLRDEMLAKATVAARAILEPDRRIPALAELADDLLVAGKPDAGRAVLDQAIEELEAVRKQSQFAYVVGRVASIAGGFDEQLVLRLLKDQQDAQGFYCAAAFRLADRDPAGAERLLRQAGHDRLSTDDRARVAASMAVSDLPRAEQILEAAISDNERVLGYGLAAVALRDQRPADALRLLEKCHRALDKILQSEYGDTWTFSTALAAVRYTELVAPDRAEDLIWRALAGYRTPRFAHSDPVQGKREIQNSLVNPMLLMALYGWFPEVTQPFLKQLRTDYVLSVETREITMETGPLFLASALVDPAAMIDEVGALARDKDRPAPRLPALMLDATRFGIGASDTRLWSWVFKDLYFIRPPGDRGD
jgi:hypothetical protein